MLVLIKDKEGVAYSINIHEIKWIDPWPTGCRIVFGQDEVLMIQQTVENVHQQIQDSFEAQFELD